MSTVRRLGLLVAVLLATALTFPAAVGATPPAPSATLVAESFIPTCSGWIGTATAFWSDVTVSSVTFDLVIGPTSPGAGTVLDTQTQAITASRKDQKPGWASSVAFGPESLDPGIDVAVRATLTYRHGTFAATPDPADYGVCATT
jgi:hypothetical protein